MPNTKKSWESRRSLRVPPEHQEAIVQAYLAGESKERAAARFGYSPMACRRALKRRGIKSRPLRTVQPCERAKVVSLYAGGMPMHRVAKETRVGIASCWRILHKEGIARPHRTLSLKEEFFSCVATEEQAYWLGFLTADGCVSKDGDRVSLSLQRRDEAHLLKFRAALGSEAPVVRFMSESPSGGHWFPQSAVHLCSRRLNSDLEQLGVIPAKSLVVKPWAGPRLLLPHYYRGLIDGDGSVRQAGRRSGGAYTVSLVGTLAVVQGLASFIEAELGLKGRVEPHKRIWCVRYHRLSSLKRIVQLLYGDASVALDRKAAAARAIMAMPGRNEWSLIPKERYLELYGQYGSWLRVARAIGVPTPSNIYSVLKRLGVPLANRWDGLALEQVNECRRRAGSDAEAARLLGMARATLRKLRHRLQAGSGGVADRAILATSACRCCPS